MSMLSPGGIDRNNKSVWEETIGEDVNKKGVGSHDRCEERVCTKEGEGVFVVKEGKERGKRVC